MFHLLHYFYVSYIKAHYHMFFLWYGNWLLIVSHQNIIMKMLSYFHCIASGYQVTYKYTNLTFLGTSTNEFFHSCNGQVTGGNTAEKNNNKKKMCACVCENRLPEFRCTYSMFFSSSALSYCDAKIVQFIIILPKLVCKCFIAVTSALVLALPRGRASPISPSFIFSFL